MIQTRCYICDEPMHDNDEAAEMYDPAWPDYQDAELVHAQCGLSRGWEIA